MFVKICGITNESDALLAVALGADAVGFIFAPSPRQVSKEQVKDIVRQLPSEVMTIGVFVNERPESVIRMVHEIGLTGAQLHGSEGPNNVEYVASRIPVVLKGFSGERPSLDRISQYQVSAVLLDSDIPGSGQPFDWSGIAGLSASVRLILAGGLNPANVAEAISVVKPFGVDVSSGIEAKPGKKDPAKLRAFISRSRAALSEVHGVLEDPEAGMNPFLQDLIAQKTAILQSSNEGVFDWEEEP
ncbi:MAG: phosphoribosylanthranilate isomerase [Actinomycetota bacterium]|nr:MAG: phosphoribosylanthranilate isomerase [Actinomycetota bacterium]